MNINGNLEQSGISEVIEIKKAEISIKVEIIYLN